MKISFLHKLFLNVASAVGHRRTSTRRGFGKFLLGTTLLFGALMPLKSIAAAWSTDTPTATNGVPKATSPFRPFTMNGFSQKGSVSMWFYNPNTLTWIGPFATTPSSSTATTITFNGALPNGQYWSFPNDGSWQARVRVGTSSSGTIIGPTLNFKVEKLAQALYISNVYAYSLAYTKYVVVISGTSSFSQIWALDTGTTASGAKIEDFAMGQVLVSATGPGIVKFKVYSPAYGNYSESLTVRGSVTIKQAQTPVVINSPASTPEGTEYVATASGGNGTGALVWSVFYSSPAGATINSSSGRLTTTGAGTITLDVYRQGDATYGQSDSARAVITVTPASFPTLSLVPGEGVTISSAVKGANSTVTFTVFDEQSTNPSLALPSGNASTITESSSVVAALVKPGKNYKINVSSSTCTDWWLNFTPPPGYSLLVNGVATNSLHVAPTALPYSALHDFMLRPESSYEGAALGFFTGVQVSGRAITWEVGLGNLRNGRSAGRLIFKESSLTDAVSRAKLYYTPPNSYGEIDVQTSNGALSKISLPQGVVDIVDENIADPSLGYWLKFSAIGATTPWKTIRVEMTAQGQLKITEKEN